MNKILLIISFIFAFLANGVSAQAGHPPKGKADTTKNSLGAERVQALKVAFITKQLNLTSDEAEKFWPIYNDYQDKRDAVRKQLAEDKALIQDQANLLNALQVKLGTSAKADAIAPVAIARPEDNKVTPENDDLLKTLADQDGTAFQAGR